MTGFPAVPSAGRRPGGRTSLWIKIRIFPASIRKKHRNERLAALTFLTFFLAMAAVVTLRVCLHVYGNIGWSGYSMLGIALFYIIVILPLWFRNPNPMIFIPIDHAAVGGYLFYICFATGGNWFLSFAFPIVALLCLLITGYRRSAPLCPRRTVVHHRRQPDPHRRLLNPGGIFSTPHI